MKKIYQYILSGTVLIFLVIACTKEITDDLVVFFKVEFSETNIDAFLNTRKASKFKIVGGGEGELNAGDFQIKYNVTEGAGSYFVNNIAIAENEFIDLQEGPEYTIEYIGTVVGASKVTLTIRDQSGREEEFVLAYTINDTAFTFDVVSSPEATYVDGKIDLNLNITEVSSATYNVKYVFGTPDTDILGSGTITIDDVPQDQETDIEVPVGDTTWEFEGVTVGIVEVSFTATSSLGIEVVKTIQIEVGETPDFTFMASTAVATLATNTSADINFEIIETVGSSLYTMTYNSSQTGTFVYNSITYQPGEEIPVIIGTSTGQYTGTVMEIHDVEFTVSNANTIPINKISEVNLTYIDPDTDAPVISLNGADAITLTVFDLYRELATATDNVDGDLTDQIVFGGDFVNTNTLGSFTRTYNVMDSSNNPAIGVSRTINIIDDVVPTISLNSANAVTISVGSRYNETATATDNYDGDLTGQIVFGGTFVNTNTVGTYTRTYNVTDSSNNVAVEIAKTINVVDDIAPVITLIGAPSFTIPQGGSYTDPGATATDNVDGNLTSAIVRTENLNVNIPGTYTIKYNVTDAAGNAAIEVIRTIIVESSINFDISTGVLTAPAGSTVVITTQSGGSGEGNASIRATDTSGTNLGIAITCWGLTSGQLCLDSDGDGVNETSGFTFTMPLNGIANFEGSHSPQGGNISSGTSFSIQVAGETFSGNMNSTNGIPQ